MNTEKLNKLLGNLSGHLVTSVREEREIEKLNRLLSRSLLPEDLGELKGSRFAFESADFFALENVPSERLESLRSMVEEQSGAEPEYRVFVRETPVRSTQIHASVPSWAGGALVELTAGPFTRVDGRQFWFDFFRIEKLVALYIQNKPNPALLFKVRSGIQFINPHLPPIVQPATSYRLPAGSIWINSEILASNAPAGFYTGLTIKGGTVTLSAAPQTINGKLTIAPNTIVTVKLQLQQPAVDDADPSSPFGVDARDASLQLPEAFSFHFSGQQHAVDEVASGRWNVYGHRVKFEWNRHAPFTYDNLTHRVLIPLQCSEPKFKVGSCKSPFHTISGEAPIKQSSWALPAAPIDILHPTPAAGIGGLMIQGGTGLTNIRQGLKGGELKLALPYLLAEPGRISISDLNAGNAFGEQTFDLWKDDLNPFGTTVELRFQQATPFFYFTFANGNEALIILGNADVKIDRPVTVAGEALSIHSKNSVLTLSVSKTSRVISLFDDNILSDSIDLSRRPPVFPKPIALALNIRRRR